MHLELLRVAHHTSDTPGFSLETSTMVWSTARQMRKPLAQAHSSTATVYELQQTSSAPYAATAACKKLVKWKRPHCD